jgi:hypothetical protein
MFAAALAHLSLFTRFSFSKSLGYPQSNISIRSDCVFASSLSPDSFLANPPISDIRHLKVGLYSIPRILHSNLTQPRWQRKSEEMHRQE